MTRPWRVGSAVTKLDGNVDENQTDIMNYASCLKHFETRDKSHLWNTADEVITAPFLNQRSKLWPQAYGSGLSKSVLTSNFSDLPKSPSHTFQNNISRERRLGNQPSTKILPVHCCWSGVKNHDLKRC